METKLYTEMTNEELLVEKKKLKNSKIFHATAIGFMAGVLIFGVAGWGASSERNAGFLIPMMIPVLFIYRMLKNPKSNEELEAVLKERGLG